MSYKYERISGEPIIIVHLFEDFNFKTDLQIATPEAVRILDGVDTPVFWVVNVLAPMDLEDLLLATQDISQGENALWKHPNIRQTVVVSQDAMIAAAGLLGGCNILYSEDMQDGLLIENHLRVCNPFTTY